MELYKEGQIEGEFTGWDGDKVFTLTNGQKWQQAKYKYRYKYKYRPKIKIYKDGSKYFLWVDCMDEMIQVRKLY
jgi:hypothetical protein